MSRIIFQDIDGPLIPLRLYFGGGRPYNQQLASFVYDPVAVGMLNHLCDKFNAKVVFNTAHNENPDHVMRHQGSVNNIQHLHPGECTTEFVRSIPNRFDAINDWLSRHNGITEWIVIDDMEVHQPRQVLVDYSLGMTMESFQNACELFGEKQEQIIGVGQRFYSDHKK